MICIVPINLNKRIRLKTVREFLRISSFFTSLIFSYHMVRTRAAIDTTTAINAIAGSLFQTNHTAKPKIPVMPAKARLTLVVRFILYSLIFLYAEQFLIGLILRS